MKKIPAPAEWNGKKISNDEFYTSPRGQKTSEDAEHQLDKIRDFFSEEYGWVEIQAWIEKDNDGYYAVRHHARYV